MTRRSSWYGLTMIAAACVPARGQSTAPTIPVPETIRAEGVPPIPASVRQGLNRYQNIRSASFQDWASDGSGMYVITRFADVPQVHFVAAASGARTQLTFLDERVLSVSARPKHDQFLYVADEGGAENYQLFLQDRKGGEARRVTDGKSRNMAPKWSPSGDLLAWSSNVRNGRDMDVYVAAPADPHFLRRLKEVSGQWTVSDWSPDETKIVAVEYKSISDSRIHVIDVDTGKTRMIAPDPKDPEAKPSYNNEAKWSKNGKSIYYITDEVDEYRHLVRQDPGPAPPVRITYSTRDIEDFALSDNGEMIAVIVNVKGSSLLLEAVDPDRFGPTLMSGMPEGLVLPHGREIYPAMLETTTLPVGVVSRPAYGPGSHSLGFNLTTAHTSSDAYCRSTTHEGIRSSTDRWTSSETGGLEPRQFAEPELIEYPTFDNHRIPAFVYRPLAHKFPGPRPVLIDIHGGPEGQSRPSFIGRLNYLVDEFGLVLIFPNVRGSSGYGKSYLKLDNGKLRADAVKDIGALLDWIATQKDIDKSRVGVTGGSYGGFMSLAVQANYNDRIKAGIDIVGISNFVSFLQNTQGYRRDLRRAEYGDERDPEMRSFLERISPLSSADKIRTPILIVQGQNDPRVPISESQQMVAALRKNKVPVWYIVGTNEGHGFAKKANQDYLQAVEVEFLRQYLLGNNR